VHIQSPEVKLAGCEGTTPSGEGELHLRHALLEEKLTNWHMLQVQSPGLEAAGAFGLAAVYMDRETKIEPIVS
jgi:hypothetical protein